MEIIVAKTAGFCFGVDRSIQALDQLIAQKSHEVSTFGPIIHNDTVVGDYKSKGVNVIDSLENINNTGIVVIRTHGIARDIQDEIVKKGCAVVDATCPFVKKIHNMVETADREGKKVFVIGSKNHPEVIGICGYAKDVKVFENVEELEKYTNSHKEQCDSPVILVAQTTLNIENWEKCCKYFKNNYTNSIIFDTICNATFKRQKEASIIAEKVDYMFVIGSKSSSNTKKLYEISTSKCANTFLIEGAGEIPLDILKQALIKNPMLQIGVTAGASTPAYVIKEAIVKMDELKEKSFEEALEESLITLNTGDRVRGIVIGFTPTEVLVQLGTKQAAYIPAAEVSNDPNVNPSDVLKVGDEIEVFVTRVNDVEGVITLSKRKVDSIRGFEEVENAYKDGTILEGRITETVKGGVIALTKGVRVFIPASQCPGKDTDLEKLVDTTQKFKIINFERRRNKVVGSIRSIEREERKAAFEKFWAEAEVGKRYKGIVKSLTSYGAFVDLGGIDGMVHVSELAWTKIKHPSIVVKVGDVIEVYIKELDKEKNRISLGYKDLTENPWKVIEEKYKVGDVVNVKIARLVKFGAFAEIIPGVDGLIHISQIADKRIESPASELKIGQEVDAKIVEIDLENQRISLSIRALLAPEEASSEEAAAPAEETVSAEEATTEAAE